jgi:hypothetical protein
LEEHIWNRVTVKEGNIGIKLDKLNTNSPIEKLKIQIDKLEEERIKTASGRGGERETSKVVTGIL